MQELGVLINRSHQARQPLASFGIDAEIVFASARDRAAFVAELTGAVEPLVAKYHAGAQPEGRKHRLIVALHPSITEGPDAPDADAYPQIHEETDQPEAEEA